MEFLLILSFILFGIIIASAFDLPKEDIFEVNPFSPKTYVFRSVRSKNIWEAKPRKNWSCAVCGKIIYAGTIAYHTGDHRDGKRTYVCSKCVDKIQNNK